VTIYYRTDGQTPTQSDQTVASGSTVAVGRSMTLTARAFRTGFTPSHVATATYTMVVATATPSPTGGTSPAPATVTLTSQTPNALIYYSTDGSTPNTNSTLYTGPFTISTTSLLQTIATRNNWTSSGVFSTVYHFNYGTLAAPTFTPAAGTNPTSV